MTKQSKLLIGNQNITTYVKIFLILTRYKTTRNAAGILRKQKHFFNPITSFQKKQCRSPGSSRAWPVPSETNLLHNSKKTRADCQEKCYEGISFKIVAMSVSFLSSLHFCYKIFTHSGAENVLDSIHSYGQMVSVI